MINHLKLPVNNLTWPQVAPESLYTVVVLAAFAGLFATEVRAKRLRYSKKTVRQAYLTNVLTWLFNDTALSLLSISSLYLIAQHYAGGGFLARIPNFYWQAAAGLVLYDLTLYFWHRASHAFEWLWTFHKAHHSDRLMNVTTAFRVHIVELLLTCVIKAAFILITGINSALLLAAEALITLNIMFHHVDVRFRGERWLGLVFIAPHLHRVHHSELRTEHDSNYGALFSVWDRLFGTFAELNPQAIGLKNVPVQGFWELLKFGFNPAANAPATNASNRDSILAMIAEAAYFRAEKRFFVPGFEMVDWFEGEREILQRMATNRPLLHC